MGVESSLPYSGIHSTNLGYGGETSFAKLISEKYGGDSYGEKNSRAIQN